MSAEDEMSTPTPRTNRAWNTIGDDNAEAAWSFARTLERELANIRALANRRNKQDHSQDTTHQLVASLDQALDIAQAELTAEREKVQTLRLACERIVEQWDADHEANPIGAGGKMYSLASKVLAATEDAP